MTFRPNWWIIGAIFEEICIYVEENEGFGQPLIPFILLIGELQMGPYMVTYWCVSECCSLIGSHRLYVYRNVADLRSPPAKLVKGVTTSTSYEYELRVSENKVQLMRIRDENGKFRSNSVSILNVTFA